jgi:hypothetical protein
MPVMAACIGRTGGNGNRRGDRDQVSDWMAESPRITLNAQYGLPWSVARLSAP